MRTHSTSQGKLKAHIKLNYIERPTNILRLCFSHILRWPICFPGVARSNSIKTEHNFVHIIIKDFRCSYEQQVLWNTCVDKHLRSENLHWLSKTFFNYEFPGSVLFCAFKFGWKSGNSSRFINSISKCVQDSLQAILKTRQELKVTFPWDAHREVNCP